MSAVSAVDRTDASGDAGASHAGAGDASALASGADAPRRRRAAASTRPRGPSAARASRPTRPPGRAARPRDADDARRRAAERHHDASQRGCDEDAAHPRTSVSSSTRRLAGRARPWRAEREADGRLGGGQRRAAPARTPAIRRAAADPGARPRPNPTSSRSAPPSMTSTLASIATMSRRVSTPYRPMPNSAAGRSRRALIALLPAHDEHDGDERGEQQHAEQLELRQHRAEQRVSPAPEIPAPADASRARRDAAQHQSRAAAEQPRQRRSPPSDPRASPPAGDRRRSAMHAA